MTSRPVDFLRALARRARPYAPLAAIGVAIAVADQITKNVVVAHLSRAGAGARGLIDRSIAAWQARHPRPTAAVAVVEDFFRLRYVENPGAAWSLFRDAPHTLRFVVLVAFASAAIAGMIWYWGRLAPAQRLARVSIAAVVGGAVGNLLDRVRLGYVVDFVEWHWFEAATFPLFNIADVAITCGVIGLLVDSWVVARLQPEPLGPRPEPG